MSETEDLETVAAVEQVEPIDGSMPPWLPDAIKLAGKRLGFALFVAGISILAFLYLVDQLSSFLTMLGTALFLSFALEPAVDWFAARGWRRGTATGLIFVILLAVIVLLLALIVPAVIQGFQSLVQSAPTMVDKLAEWLKPLGIDLSTEELIQKLQQNAQQIISSATNLAGSAFGIASSLIGGLFRWATIGLFTFYLVAQGPQFRRALLSRMRPERQARVLFVWEQAIQQTGGYFYSRLLLAVINGSGMYLTLRLTNVPFAAPLAIFEGLIAEFIPIVGTYIGGAVPVLVAFLASTSSGLWALGYILVYQQVENYILSPRITARTMSLHPAVAFAAALIGGALGGIFTAFLALPVAGVIQASVKEWGKSYDVMDDVLTEPTPEVVRVTLMERARRRFGSGPSPPDDGSGR
ncbi:MAG: AI-2E family transporter [Actinobacteria bacterium]|nr:MAG: AI-2E family transporter [Actinomycetota bacterium]